MKNRYIELKDSWLDKKGSTETMFISESPPVDFGRYFYNMKSSNISNLRQDLFEAVGIDDKGVLEEQIEAFIRRYWLTHLFYAPIREVDVEEIPDHIDELKRETKRIDPERIKLILPSYDSDSIIELLTEKLKIVLGREDVTSMTLSRQEMTQKEKIEKLVELISEEEV